MAENNRPTTEYYSGKNKVVAKLANTRTIADEMEKYGRQEMTDSDYCINFYLEGVLNHFIPDFHKKEVLPQFHNRIFTGTATCDERDEFSFEKGKKIASLKADLKYHNKMFSDYMKIMLALNKFGAMLLTEGEKHARCSDQIYDKLVKEYGWKDERGDAE